MFQNYTDAARRVIFYARAAAGEDGSRSIEPQHVALAFLSEKDSLIRTLLTPDAVPLLEQDIKELLVHGSPIPPQADLPISRSMKRVFSDIAAAAQKLKSRHIDSGHLLLGLLTDIDCPVARILERHGITRDRVLRLLADAESAAPERPQPVVTREQLIALVATLPEEALGMPHAVLTRLQA